MRPHNPIDALIEHLLSNPLADFATIRRNAHERRHCWRRVAGAKYLPAIEHELQAVAQGTDIVGSVLHLEHYAVIGSGINRLGRPDLRR